MTDRRQVLFGLTTPEDKTLFSSLCDKADKTILTGVNMYTRFLAPRELNMAVQRLSPFADIRTFGGYDGAERAVVCFYDGSYGYEYFDWPICAVKVTANGKAVMNHRDYMGSLLGLGIKREMLGDIVVCSEYAVVFCHSDIADFIVYNLTKVGRMNVSAQVCRIEELELPERTYKDKSATVSSLRLDCVVSAATNMSRSTASEAVQRGSVFHNYEEAKSASRTVSDGDIISVRGYGKYVISCDGSLTKKGRYHIDIRQYI